MTTTFVMIQFTATIQRFGEKGEKTGWSYILITRELAEKLKPGYKKAFRVKGKLDNYPVSQLALIPMGQGDFILTLNANIRKAIHKNKGAMVHVSLTEDKKAPEISAELKECLADAPKAEKNFNSLPKSHQMYFSKWIESAKTVETKAKRIGLTIQAMEKNLRYNEMLRLNAQSVNK